MSSQRLHGCLITLCLLLSCRFSVAADSQNSSSSPSTPAPMAPVSSNATSTYGTPANPSAIPDQVGSNATTPPAAMALPVTTDVTTRKFYTLTASLREIYDDNVNTSNSNPQASFETVLSPSVLVDFPTTDGDFSARYTMTLTYYTVGPNNGVNNNSTDKNGPETQFTQEFIAQYTHNFSDRFNLNLSDGFRDFTQPSLDQSTGTNYENGPYISNVFSGSLSAQWTPLIGTTSSYSNSVVRYDNSTVAQFQDSVENTGTQVISYAIRPKVSLDVGVIVDDISYTDAQRGYTTYTGFGGASWQVLPSLSLSGRGGATYIEPVVGTSSISPYGALTIAWTIGARSTLTFDYAHEITPSDQIGANGQTSDRFSSNVTYEITPRLSSHLSANYTHGDVSNTLATAGGGNGQQQDVYYVDTGLAYHYNSYLDLDTGVTLSGVSNEDSSNTNSNSQNYTRDQLYLGVRGTY
jgi:hypothetical protein